MRSITSEDYAAMREGAEVVAADQHGDKVLLLADGTYLKLFRVKRLFTSARIFPYWRRFVDNAAGLAEIQIPTFRVIEVLDIPEMKRTGVHYEPLPGSNLRELATFDETLVRKLGVFINTLHDKGVYLRSMHLGNVVMTPEGELGLIDIADMRLHGKPLSRGKRLRNFRHLARYVEDRKQVAEHLDAFLDAFDGRLRQGLLKMFKPEG